MSTFGHYKIDRLSKSCNGVILEILMGTMSTCILVLVVPMVMGIIAPLTAVTCAPSPKLYWLSLFVKTI